MLATVVLEREHRCRMILNSARLHEVADEVSVEGLMRNKFRLRSSKDVVRLMGQRYRPRTRGGLRKNQVARRQEGSRPLRLPEVISIEGDEHGLQGLEAIWPAGAVSYQTELMRLGEKCRSILDGVRRNGGRNRCRGRKGAGHRRVEESGLCHCRLLRQAET